MDTHWRNTMKPARFFALDAFSVFPFMLVLIHVRLWTIILAAVVTTVFWISERMGLRLLPALRAVRAWFVAPVRPAQAYQLNRRMADLGRLDMIEEAKMAKASATVAKMPPRK
jgi:intracellular multiplication protein IcmT